MNIYTRPMDLCAVHNPLEIRTKSFTVDYKFKVVQTQSGQFIT